MYDAQVKPIGQEQVYHYVLRRTGDTLTYREFLDALRYDVSFRSFFQQLLVDCPFKAYRWETPPVSHARLGDEFEFVLLNSPRFVERPTDHHTFADQFSRQTQPAPVISFSNLGKDATLIVPTPQTTNDVYGHLAVFVREAPKTQVDAFWSQVGNIMAASLTTSPLWLSAAGAGVAWLHLRIDRRPKYYGHAPYRVA